MELTPPVAYRMSLTAAEVEELLLSIYTKIPTDTIRTSLDSPDGLTIPTTKAVADAIAVINADLEQLGDLALLNSIDLGSDKVVGVGPVSKGGTGASNLAQAQFNLGIVIETQIQTMIDTSITNIQSIDLGSSRVSGILPLSKGGTGATEVSQARDNLQVWSSDQSEIVKIDVRESLRRSYAESWYTMVSGSFEEGGTIATSSEVMLYEAEGKAYSWEGQLPKTLPANTTPANSGGVGVGAWVDRSGSSSTKVISIKDPRFAGGAKGDGINNDAPAIQAAIDYAASIGGGEVVCPAGVYSIGAKLTPGSNITVRGCGKSATKFIIPVGVTTRNAIFFHTNPAISFTNFTLEDIGFVGRWNEYRSEISDNGIVTLKFITNLTIRKCAFHYSRGFVLNVNECNTALIEGNIFEYAPRDMIAIWDTPDVRVLNNILRHNDDDGISISTEAVHIEPVRSRVIVTGNILEDTGPIRTQSPKNITITNNVISRTRGGGITVGVLNFSTNDISSGHGIIVANNVITDVIDRHWFVDGTQVGSANSRIYIAIDSIPLQAGTLPVPPGEIDPNTGTVQSPYDFYYKKASIAAAVGSIRAPNAILVCDNICKRTLPAASAYSDWGYGQAYTKNGFVDYQVPDAILRGIGSRIQLPITNLKVTGNLFEAGRYGIMLDMHPGMPLKSMAAKNVLISDNIITDFDLYGINWNPSAISHQDITIRNNSFDGDPLFISSKRGPNGTWTVGNSGPAAIHVNQLGSITINGNKIKNCAATLDQTGVSSLQYVEGNLLYADAAVVGFSTSNKGIGTIPPIGSGQQWWLQFEDSDPTSTTYGQSLGANLKNQSGMPSSGKYLTGMIVQARPSGPIGSVGSQYLITGYLRRTTGTSHVLNTDWTELRSLTGT